MKAETDPIASDEWLLRIVHTERLKNGRVSPDAFQPRIKARDPDTTGISLYRLACHADPSDVLVEMPVEKRKSVGIVRIPTSCLEGLGLSINSEPTSIPGHVVIPELNSSTASASKATVKAVIVRLAAIASEEGNILVWPIQAPQV